MYDDVSAKFKLLSPSDKQIIYLEIMNLHNRLVLKMSGVNTSSKPFILSNGTKVWDLYNLAHSVGCMSEDLWLIKNK